MNMSQQTVLFQTIQITTNSILQPKVQCITNKSMADTHFIQPFNLFMNKPQILQTQIMTGIQSHT